MNQKYPLTQGRLLELLRFVAVLPVFEVFYAFVYDFFDLWVFFFFVCLNKEQFCYGYAFWSEGFGELA